VIAEINHILFIDAIGSKRARTADILLVRQTLYQLSYTPKSKFILFYYLLYTIQIKTQSKHNPLDCRTAGLHLSQKTFLFFIYSTIIFTSASLVQLVERRSPKPDVVGSSPTGRASLSLFIKMSNLHQANILLLH
jgi:hypothetical protein